MVQYLMIILVEMINDLMIVSFICMFYLYV